jgi:hypothetical protein
MRSKRLILLLLGIGIFGIGSTVAVQSAITSHTVQGKVTAVDAANSSVACDKVQVKAELWLNTKTRTGPMPEIGLGSTTAKGKTMGEGCTYTLTFNDVRLPQLPVASQYRLSANGPTPGEDSLSGYAHNMSRPYPEQYDMSF